MSFFLSSRDAVQSHTLTSHLRQKGNVIFQTILFVAIYYILFKHHILINKYIEMQKICRFIILDHFTGFKAANKGRQVDNGHVWCSSKMRWKKQIIKYFCHKAAKKRSLNKVETGTNIRQWVDKHRRGKNWGSQRIEVLRILQIKYIHLR